MNRAQRLAYRLLRRFVPQVPKLIDAADREISNLSERLRYARAELSTARETREASWIAEEVSGMVSIAEAGGVSKEPGTIQLKERLAELELALEDRGWKRQLAIADSEFSRYGIQQIILISQLYFIKNPLIKRGVTIASYYVFGRGMEISTDDETANVALQAFLDANRKELGHRGLTQKEVTLYTDGNLFFVFFTDLSTGEINVRTISALEIQEIITDPDDVSRPWYYHRRWMSKGFDPATGVTQVQPADCWYPDAGYDPPDKPPMIGGAPVMWDSPIMHEKIGALPKWHFGVPDVYAALDWARAYKSFLEDWATINRALARFAWDVKTEGGAPAISNFQRMMSTTLADGGNSVEYNPPPTVGSAFISGPKNTVTPIKTAGTTTTPEEGRRILLMVAAAFGLPETFFGDASVGSLATATSLDRPTELKFLEAQERWRELLQRICRYALSRSAMAPSGRLKESKDKVDNITVSVTFPAVLEHDIGEMVTAIVSAATLNGNPLAGTIDPRTLMSLLLSELGVENPEAVMDAMYPDSSYDPIDYADDGSQPAPVATTVPKPTQEARLAAAVDQLRKAARRITK
jgi:hypothetical protein